MGALQCLLLTYLFILPCLSQYQPVFHVIREWNYINFTWNDQNAYNNAKNARTYVRENVIPAGMRYFEGYFYITLPRMKNGVPATLTRIRAGDTFNTSPLLEPFPSWDMNRVDDCNALQNVQNIEIDSRGQLWIIDGGHTSTLMQPPVEICPPKLLIYDIRSNRIITVFNFPDDVTSRKGSFLYDIVVDESGGGYAYITDNSGSDPGLIVFSLRKNRAWKLREDRSMKADPNAVQFSVDGVQISSPINLAAIALGPKYYDQQYPYGSQQYLNSEERQVYFCPLSSLHLYAANASALKNEESRSQFGSSKVTDLGLKHSQTAAMIMDNQGLLYYGLLGDTSIARFDTRFSFQAGQRTISRDKEFLQWISSLTFDDVGNLTVLTNKLQLFVTGKMDTSIPNFRLMTSYVGGKSYIYDFNYNQYGPMNVANDGASTLRNNPSSSGYPSQHPQHKSSSSRTVVEVCAIIFASLCFTLLN